MKTSSTYLPKAKQIKVVGKRVVVIDDSVLLVQVHLCPDNLHVLPALAKLCEAHLLLRVDRWLRFFRTRRVGRSGGRGTVDRRLGVTLRESSSKTGQSSETFSNGSGSLREGEVLGGNG